MIIRMARVRIAGPRRLLERTLALLQDDGDLHLIAPLQSDVAAAPPADPFPRRTRHIRRILDDVEAVLAALPGVPARSAGPAESASLPQAAHRARRLRRELTELARARASLVEEQALLLRYRAFVEAFDPLLQRAAQRPDTRASFVLLRAGAGASIAALERSLQAAARAKIEMHARTLPSGEIAVLMLASGGPRRRSSACSPRRASTSCPRPRSLPRPTCSARCLRCGSGSRRVRASSSRNDTRRGEIADGRDRSRKRCRRDSRSALLARRGRRRALARCSSSSKAGCGARRRGPHGADVCANSAPT